MYEKIYIAENTYIEYDIDNQNQINHATLQVIKDGKINSILSDGTYQGILASLIENNINGTENQSSTDICINSWPPEYDFSNDFDFERNLRDNICKIRKQFAILIGETAAKELLPRKKAGFSHKIVFSTENITSSLQNSKSITPSSISFKTLNQLNALGLSNSKVAEQITANDIALFGFPENSPEEGSALKWQEFMDEDPVGWGFLFDETTKSIVGNYSSVIISKEQRKLLFNGVLNDGELDLDKTLSFHPGQDYTLYILNISVNTSYNTPQNRSLLFDNFFNMILEQAKAGIFFKEIFFTSWRFRKALIPYGFKFKDDIIKNDKSIVMAIEDFPNQLLWNRADELTEIYNTKRL